MIRHMVANEIVDGFEDILLLTSYNRQKRLLDDSINHLLRDILPPGRQFTASNLSTVDSAEGSQGMTVIYSPGRNEHNTDNVGEASLINDLRSLYVLSSRAKRRFYIVGSRDFFRANCPRWAEALNFFEQNPIAPV